MRRQRRGERLLPVVTPAMDVVEIEREINVRALERETTSSTYARGAVRVGTTW